MSSRIGSDGTGPGSSLCSTRQVCLLAVENPPMISYKGTDMSGCLCGRQTGILIIRFRQSSVFGRVALHFKGQYRRGIGEHAVDLPGRSSGPSALQARAAWFPLPAFLWTVR